MAITIDGANKRIILDTTNVSASQIWSAWVDWHPLNSKWPIAFYQTGGNDLGGGLFIPPYFFLMNGWRVRPMEANHNLVITGNLFVDGGGVPVVQTLGNFQVAVNYTVPVQAQGIATSGSTGPSAGDIALEVWNMLKTTIFLDNSMGEHVKSLGNSASNVSYYELPVSVIRVVGSDQGGDISTLQSHDDNLFSTGEVSGSGLEVIVNFNNAELYNPQRCLIVGRYAGSAGHTMYIQAYDFTSEFYETRGVMTNRTDAFHYTIPLSVDNISPTGDVQIRFIHSVGTYLNSHRLYLDYVQVELMDTNSTLISDINAIKSKTDQMEFILGRVNANAQMISDSTAAADAVETNIQNLDSKVSTVKTLVLAGL